LDAAYAPLINRRTYTQTIKHFIKLQYCVLPEK